VFSESVETVARAAGAKGALLKQSLTSYLIASILAGAYVGLGIVFIFAIGAPLAAAQSPFLKTVMGASFGVALTLVVFAGSELFTGNALVLAVAGLERKAGLDQIGAIWGWSYFGNLVGSVAVAWLVAQSGALGGDPQRGFVESVAATKMGLPFWPAFVRGILANWLVCLAVWCALRTSNDVTKLVLIFWCLFAFIGAGFEHSVANMTLLAIALFQQHGEAITWAGYIGNLIPVTLGNLVGGAVFVGGAYWLAARSPSLGRLPSAQPVPVPIATQPAVAPITAEAAGH
jgi:nitrite transporter NirC